MVLDVAVMILRMDHNARLSGKVSRAAFFLAHVIAPLIARIVVGIFLFLGCGASGCSVERNQKIVRNDWGWLRRSTALQNLLRDRNEDKSETN